LTRKKVVIQVGVVICLIFTSFVLIKPKKIEARTVPYFTLKAMTNAGGDNYRTDMLFFLNNTLLESVYMFKYNQLNGLLS
jgi:hypothetical protein